MFIRIKLIPSRLAGAALSTSISFLPIAFLILSLSVRPSLAALIAGPEATVQNGIACFLAENFPAADTPLPDPDVLADALKGLAAKYFTGPEELSRALNDGQFKALLLPFGSAFPADAWPAIRAFLRRGGNLIYLGGNPFNLPVYLKDGRWTKGTAQPTFAHQLLIGPADLIGIGSEPFYSGIKAVSAGASGFESAGFPLPSRVFEPTVRFTTNKYFRNEDGGAGPREAVMRPLVHLVNGNGLPVACPLYIIDRTGGEAAGGRWVISPSDAPLPSKIIRKCVELAVQGASELKAIPVHASVNESETPVIRINYFRPGRNGPESMEPPSAATVYFDISVKDRHGKRVFQSRLPAAGTREYATAEAVIKTSRPLTPGLYTVEVSLSGRRSYPDRTVTGFRVFDKKLLASAPKLHAGRDWLFKDGRPFPVVGTTYMASDVAREFLFEPNPYLWDRDFAEMHRAGVNMIRTGIWTGWQRMILAPGAFDEGVLRALDAFVQTAAENGIVVCFTFFAFSPPLGGGTNPYLDPRALRWQENFITAIVSRFKDCGWIHWDLINEPSYSPPDDLWKNIPVGDSYERTAWMNWLLKRHPEAEREIADNWRASGGDLFSLPSAADLAYAMIRNNRLPRKALDFSLFTQDVAAGWAARLAAVIRAAGGGLITLGQDEGGTENRPKQQFFYPAVDYTSIHTWWLNDDLLWDVASTKVPEKPNLISETGLMRLEDIDGRAWRTPQAARDLLERKFAFSFMGRGAGVLEWIWNINPYMPIDNEAVIGFKRPDGTFKTEIEVLGRYASFFEKAATKLGDFEPEPVILVSPDAKMFSGEPQALDGVRRLVRVLAGSFGLVPAVLSEFKLTPERLAGAKLIIVPSPHWFSDQASRALAAAARAGTVVLFTGPAEGNEYGKKSREFLSLGLQPESVPVAHYEKTRWGADKDIPSRFVTFGALKSQYLKKSLTAAPAFEGCIIHEPLPLEYAEENEPLISLLAAALSRAGLTAEARAQPIASRVLLARDSALAVLVNESSADVNGAVNIDGRILTVPVKAGRTAIVLFDRLTGEILIQSPKELTK